MGRGYSHFLETPVLERLIPCRVNQKTFCFKRSHRLLRARDYKNVFDQSHFRASHKNTLVLARRNEKNVARLGLVFGKKNIALSVDRNRLKRISREQFRLHKHGLSGLDVIIVARSGAGGLENNTYKDLILNLMGNIKQQFLGMKEK